MSQSSRFGSLEHLRGSLSGASLLAPVGLLTILDLPSLSCIPSSLLSSSQDVLSVCMSVFQLLLFIRTPLPLG